MGAPVCRPPQVVARAARPLATRSGQRGGGLAAARELSGGRPHGAQPRDGAAAGGRARPVAAPAEHAAARRRLRADLARERARRTRARSRQPGARLHAGPAGALRRLRGGPPLEPAARQPRWAEHGGGPHRCASPGAGPRQAHQSCRCPGGARCVASADRELARGRASLPARRAR